MQMRSPFDRGNPMFMPSAMLTAPNNTNGSSSINNDDDWESMMEINTSDEAEKIRALIGDKPLPTTDPNQCIVCRRVLSCKSALQMHYRTHTGRISLFRFSYKVEFRREAIQVQDLPTCFHNQGKFEDSHGGASRQATLATICYRPG
jgi:hypothetical protein